MAQRRGRFDGKTLAELRAWAGKLAEQGYPIPYASRLRGADLLRECILREVGKIHNAENRFRAALGAAPIVGKRARDWCGCRVEITGVIERSMFPMAGTGQSMFPIAGGAFPLIVPGRYIELCHDCTDTWSTAEHRNAMADLGRKFRLCNLTLVPRPVNPAIAEAKIAQVTTPTATETAIDAAFTINVLPAPAAALRQQLMGRTLRVNPGDAR